MIVSEARRASNRRDVEKSCGPKTPERSRADALKLGLCSSTLVPEDTKVVQARAEQLYVALRPQDGYQSWLLDQVTVLSLRIDRSARIERRIRDIEALRSELTWDDDRRLEVERLGAGLALSPAEVVEGLRKTPQGCEWLMTRWAMLAYSADLDGGWTKAQEKLAFDLLGTPAEFREGKKPGASIDFDGRLVEGAEDPARVARREIAALRGRRETVADLDEVNRTLAGVDLSIEPGADLKRQRRHESALHHRLRWLMEEFRKEPPQRRPNPGLRPNWHAEPEAEPGAEPAEPAVAARPKEPWQATPPNPPFDLREGESIEDGIPALLASRRDQKLRKAENRREARRKKLDRLRA